MVLDMLAREDAKTFEAIGGNLGMQAFSLVFFQRKGYPSILDFWTSQFFDTVKNSDRDRIGMEWGGALTIRKLPPHPFSFLSQPSTEIESSVSFNVHYAFEELHIEKIFDLRYADAQVSLLERFFPRTLTCKDPISVRDAFCKVLPHLMSEALGGNSATEDIGRWLRTNGANGMDYPSARLNPWVQFKKGELVNFGGWNFLDYRGATLAERTLPKSIEIPMDDTQGVMAECPAINSEMCDHGSWRMLGRVEKQMATWRQSVARSMSTHVRNDDNP